MLATARGKCRRERTFPPEGRQSFGSWDADWYGPDISQWEKRPVSGARRTQRHATRPSVHSSGEFFVSECLIQDGLIAAAGALTNVIHINDGAEAAPSPHPRLRHLRALPVAGLGTARKPGRSCRRREELDTRGRRGARSFHKGRAACWSCLKAVSGEWR